jgi:hypothetical protein
VTSENSTFRAAPCRKPTPPKDKNIKKYKKKGGVLISGGGGVRRGVKKHVKIGQKTPIYRKVDLAIAEP